MLGILVMNVYAYAMPFAAYSSPLVMGGLDPVNMGTWFATHVFADQKFMTIFSLLFGAGIVLMSKRATAKGVDPGPWFYRRQFWLLAIGAIHGFFLFFGDILFHYALVGMIAFAFRNLSPRVLLTIAATIFPIALLFSLTGSAYLAELQADAEAFETLQSTGVALTSEQSATVDEWSQQRKLIGQGTKDIEQDLAAHRGSYGEVLAWRIPLVARMQLDYFLFFVLWRVGALMLAGMAMMKLGILSGEYSQRYYRRLAVAGMGAGLPLTVFSAVDLRAHDFELLYIFGVGQVANYVGSVLVALGYVGLVMLFVGSHAAPRLRQGLAAAGRMALTNYLLQSVVMTTIFYGYGLGFYGSVPRSQQMALVAALVLAQLALSVWWLARYRFGPVEWLWRSLSYRERQPLRRGA